LQTWLEADEARTVCTSALSKDNDLWPSTTGGRPPLDLSNRVLTGAWVLSLNKHWLSEIDQS